MGEWTEEQRQRAEQAHQEALDRAEREVDFKPGDHALCPTGPVKIIEVYIGTYNVALLEDIENGRDPEDVAFSATREDLKPLPEE